MYKQLWDANGLNGLKFKRQIVSVKHQEFQYCIISKESEHKLSLNKLNLKTQNWSHLMRYRKCNDHSGSINQNVDREHSDRKFVVESHCIKQ